MVLWSSAVAAVASVLPWYEDDGSYVWGIASAGLVTFALALFALWRAAMFGSPVTIGVTLVFGLLVAFLFGFGLAGNYSTTGLPLVVAVAFGVGLVGCWRMAPAR